MLHTDGDWMRRMCPELDRLRHAYGAARDVYLSAIERVALSNGYSAVSEALIAYVTVKERDSVLRQHSIEHGCGLSFVSTKRESSKLGKVMISSYFTAVGFAMFFLSLLKNPG